MSMIKMNHYMHGQQVMTTADLLRGASTSLGRVADSMDKPNELLAMLNEVFDVITRDKVADKIAQLATGLIQLSEELRGPMIDQRPLIK
jgi:hypothetical protein